MSSVSISAYSPEWPILCRQLRQQLLSVVSSVAVTIEHIGSTSVPGLSAKPVIDMLLGAGSLRDIESKIASLDAAGYTYVKKHEQVLPMRRYFVKNSDTPLRAHLHAVELGSRIWQEHLAFRELLRTDDDFRARYQSLKFRLAHEHAHDKAAYTTAKDPFIRAALAAVAGNSTLATNS